MERYVSFRMMEPAAPSLETVMEEARAAKSRHSGIVFPASHCARKNPEKVSPAAVVSTAFAG